MSDAVILVPIVRPPSYLPAWAEKPPGVRVSRTLDLGGLLADRGLRLAHVVAELEPPLVADTFDETDVAITFFLADVPAATAKTRLRVRFSLGYSDGSEDEIVAVQPIGATAPGGLVAVDTTNNLLAVGGELVTVGGIPIRVEG